MSNSIALDLVALAMSSNNVADQAAPQRTTRSLMLQRVLYYIRDNLADPTMTPTSISLAHGISVRYLSMVFEGLGMSVDRTIWQQRLERCARELADPAKRFVTITDIAFSWGFSDSAHFSRSFKTAFGTSPREYRQLNLIALQQHP
jgi:AraC-like DNA-binding protein